MGKKKILIFGGLLMVITSFSWGATIESVGSGGAWNSTNTWVGHQIPGSTDTVVINGTVTLDIDATIAGLTVSSDSTLQNDTLSRTLTVNGDVVNNGIISVSYSNSYDNNFYVNVHGDIENNGGVYYMVYLYLWGDIQN